MTLQAGLALANHRLGEVVEHISQTMQTETDAPLPDVEPARTALDEAIRLCAAYVESHPASTQPARGSAGKAN